MQHPRLSLIIAVSTVGCLDPTTLNESPIDSGFDTLADSGESDSEIGDPDGVATFDGCPGTGWICATNLVDAPEARRHHTAVWTGDEMII